MKIQVIVREERNMGDHGEFVTIAHEVQSGETVEHFVARVLKLGEFQSRWTSTNYANWIELRVTEGSAEPEPPTPTPDPWAEQS